MHCPHYGSNSLAVLEDDFASLVGLGFPLSLSLQLQESCLRLNQALWTAKSTKGGFSVSFFWPASDSKIEAMPKRRMRKRRCKANTKLVPAMCTDQIAPLNLPKLSSEVTKAAVATQTLIRANHSPAQSQSLSIQQTQGSDLQNRESKEIVCDDAQDLKGIDSAEDKESEDKTDGDDQNEAARPS